MRTMEQSKCVLFRFRFFSASSGSWWPPSSYLIWLSLTPQCVYRTMAYVWLYLFSIFFLHLLSKFGHTPRPCAIADDEVAVKLKPQISSLAAPYSTARIRQFCISVFRFFVLPSTFVEPVFQSPLIAANSSGRQRPLVCRIQQRFSRRRQRKPSFII